MVRFLACWILPITCAAAVAAVSQTSDQGSPQAERGRYLVEEVARCGMCHTPHDQQGQEDRGRRLQGGALWFEPVKRMQNWAYSAPALAGLPAFTAEEAIRILESGVTPDGRKLRAPMPPFRLAREDAAAIVAYLKSLRPPLR